MYYNTLEVVLVPVKPFPAFLHPSGVDVLVGVVVPEFIALAFLYLLVLLACVALPRDYDKARIDNLALIHNQPYAVEILVESLEQ